MGRAMQDAVALYVASCLSGKSMVGSTVNLSRHSTRVHEFTHVLKTLAHRVMADLTAIKI